MGLQEDNYILVDLTLLDHRQNAQEASWKEQHVPNQSEIDWSYPEYNLSLFVLETFIVLQIKAWHISRDINILQKILSQFVARK